MIELRTEANGELIAVGIFYPNPNATSAGIHAGVVELQAVEPAAPVPQSQRRRIALLTHAETDLLALRRARAWLPAELDVTGVSLLRLQTDEHLSLLLEGELASAGAIVRKSVAAMKSQRRRYRTSSQRMPRLYDRFSSRTIAVPREASLKKANGSR